LLVSVSIFTAISASAAPIRKLGITFTLDNSAVPLDLAAISSFPSLVTDADGNPITGVTFAEVIE
jgi:hypothetical protein